MIGSHLASPQPHHRAVPESLPKPGRESPLLRAPAGLRSLDNCGPGSSGELSRLRVACLFPVPQFPHPWHQALNS